MLDEVLKKSLNIGMYEFVQNFPLDPRIIF